jgi:thioredoxin-like negative regulator of GroEL
MLGRGASVEEVLALVPDRTSALTLAATGLYEAGHAAGAEPVFRRVLERQPSNAVAQVGIAECLLSQRRWAEAAEAARDRDGSPVAPALAEAELFALAVSGSPAETALARAREDGLAPEIAAVFAAWAAGGPRPTAASADTIVRVLEALLRVQEFTSFERVVGLLDGCLPERERRETLARLYFRRGFLQSAADEWLAVVADAPDVDAFVGLAQVAVANGDVADAAEIAREAVRLDPGHASAQALWTALEAA